MIFITASAPTKGSLGATNGLAQMSVSVSRAFGPGMATSLFSFSAECNLLGGYAVYVILFVMSCFALLLAMCLPDQMWKEPGDEEDTLHTALAQ